MKKGKRWYDKIERLAKNRPQGSFKTISWYQEQIKRLKNENMS